MAFRIAPHYLALFLTVLSTVARAQEATGVFFQYSVDPPTTSVIKPRRIRILLRNEGIADVSIVQIALTLGAELADARDDIPPLLPCPGRIDPFRLEEQLAAGKEVELTFEYPRGSFWLPLTNLELLVFEPGSRKLEFSAQIQNPLNGHSSKMVRTIDFDAQAPTLAVTLGGAVGALLLVLLRALWHLRPSRGRKRSFKRELYEAGIALGAGTVIAFILTFVGGFLSNRALGLQIAATNFRGGFVIGLFSYKIADLWAKKLWH